MFLQNVWFPLWSQAFDCTQLWAKNVDRVVRLRIERPTFEIVCFVVDFHSEITVANDIVYGLWVCWREELTLPSVVASCL